MDSTPHLDLHLGEGDLLGGALTVLATIRPNWPKDHINSKIFTDGITNKLIGCWLDTDPECVVLVRVYGQNTDLLIDRKAETFNFKVLHKAGYAPKLYATFTNGLAYEFVPGDVLTTENVRQLSIYPLVARMMAKFHKVDCGPTATKKPLLWDKINRYLEVIVSDGVPEGNMDKLPYNIETIKMEVDYLRKSLQGTTSKVVFCHNDLLVANIIHRDGKITFIDYEYAGYNYQAFDIGNHFAEFAGVSDVDYNRYPGRDFQMTWLKVYLDEFLKTDESTESINENTVEELYCEVNKFSLASHLLWACWALVQAQHSTIDFDFIGYSKVRMDEYFSKKELFLSLPNSF